jgi:uncharacterized protein YaaQ
MNKMVMAIIPRDEAELVLDALIEAGYSATFMETKGGMLRQSQYTLFIAIKDKDLEAVCTIIKTNCMVDVNIQESDSNPANILDELGSNKLGGAVVFVWNLNRVDIY